MTQWVVCTSRAPKQAGEPIVGIIGGSDSAPQPVKHTRAVECAEGMPNARHAEASSSSREAGVCESCPIAGIKLGDARWSGSRVEEPCGVLRNRLEQVRRDRQALGIGIRPCDSLAGSSERLSSSTVRPVNRRGF